MKEYFLPMASFFKVIRLALELYLGTLFFFSLLDQKVREMEVEKLHHYNFMSELTCSSQKYSSSLVSNLKDYNDHNSHP